MTKRLRVVQVGCGSIAAVWLQAAQPLREIELVACVDVDASAAKARRDEFAPEAEVGTDAAKTIGELRPDVVFNCTRPEGHHEVSRAALRAGAHVLSEKPLAVTLAQGRDLVDEAAKAHRVLMVAQNYRFRAAPRKVREVLASGLIGHVTTMTCDYFDALHFGNFRERMEHPLLVEMAIHHFDLARFFGADEPTRVDCCEWNPAGSWYRQGANAFATFQFASDLVFSYRGSWCAEGRATSGSGEWRFCGTKGTLTWDGAQKIEAETVARAGGFRSELQRREFLVPAATGGDESHREVMREFVACVRSGRQPETSAQDNVRSLAMVSAALADVKTRRGPRRISTLPLASMI
jgi:Predicted dehydrogenases and related proteins